MRYYEISILSIFITCPNVLQYGLYKNSLLEKQKIKIWILLTRKLTFIIKPIILIYFAGLRRLHGRRLTQTSIQTISLQNNSHISLPLIVIQIYIPLLHFHKKDSKNHGSFSKKVSRFFGMLIFPTG